MCYILMGVHDESFCLCVHLSLMYVACWWNNVKVNDSVNVKAHTIGEFCVTCEWEG